MTAPSVLRYVGEQSHDHCGYCGHGPSRSWGMTVESMSCDDYQELVDRGWRRSGTYMYKPNLKETCCPPYTIRLDATKFKPSKGHKSLLRKIKKMAAGESDDSADDTNVPPTTAPPLVAPQPTAPSSTASATAASATTVPSSAPRPQLSSSSSSLLAPDISNGPTPPQQKKKRVKKEGEAQRASAGLVPVNFRAMFDGCVSENTAVKDAFTVDLVPAEFRMEDFELYKKYQIAVHGDDPDDIHKNGYTRFLVTSPLQLVENNGIRFGSFHQHYRLNGKLVALGVIDILPKCVSSVYVFYDPDLRNLALGVFSALQEIDLALSLHTTHPNLHYYYMGFYIHSCPKMRYKAGYQPSELLDQPTLTWVPLDECVLLLEKDPHVISLYQDKPLTSKLGLPPYFPPSQENPTKADISRIRVRVRGKILDVISLGQPRLVLFLAECARLIGKTAQDHVVFDF